LPDSELARAHARIRGRVQGVFFRDEARSRARTRNVAGWVRNDTDGTVEAVFEGGREAVESLLRWCERGPSGARVDAVDVEWQEPAGERDFQVR
jgi:acylphosphatase